MAGYLLKLMRIINLFVQHLYCLSAITIPIGDKKPESAIKTGDKLSKESARKNEILIYIAENGKASTAEISKAVGLGLSRTRELVNKLASEGKLKAVGENKNRRYILGGE